MDQHGELSRLEELVERLLQHCTAMREDKKRLAEQLLAKESEITALAAGVENLKTEKQQVLQRVSGLLELLEKWEGEADHDAASASGPAEALDSRITGSAG